MRKPAIFSFMLLLTFCLVSTLFFIGCDNSVTPEQPSHQAPSPKVVSLSPALTQMLIDMGKADHLVGLAEYDNDTLDLPVCGNYLKPDIERIIMLEPDLILTQASDGVVPARLAELRDAGVFDVIVIPHIHSIREIDRALNGPGANVGQAMGDSEAASAASDLMNARLQAVSAVVADNAKPRVLMLMSTAPMRGIGPEVTHDELLKLAGGVNVLADAAVPYVNIDRQMLIEQLRPEVILLLSPGAPPLTDGDARLRPLEGLPIPAVLHDRVVLITHAQTLLPSTTLAQVLVEMAKALHPEESAVIEKAYELAGEEAADETDEASP